MKLAKRCVPGADRRVRVRTRLQPWESKLTTGPRVLHRRCSRLPDCCERRDLALYCWLSPWGEKSFLCQGPTSLVLAQRNRIPARKAIDHQSGGQTGAGQEKRQICMAPVWVAEGVHSAERASEQPGRRARNR